jgi:dihydrofolate synthase/folylpolyglutamate synthase
MNYTQALDFIEQTGKLGSKPGLERIAELLRRFGDPQKRLKFIHVAGTNGKGSTCAMIESVLRASEYTVGLFISPYVEDYRERMQIDRGLIPKDTFASIITEIAAVCAEMPEHPRKFEIETAAAIIWFADRQCDAVVLEVGLGGRLDATNVIPSPEVAVITSISYDHMEILGDTLEKIRAEKRGIIKPGCAVVEASALSAATDIKLALGSTRFHYMDEDYTIPLTGAHQVENAAVAVETVTALRLRGWRIPPYAVKIGLAAVKWAGRFEIVRDDPLCIIDGAHNIDGMTKLCDIIDELLPNRRLITVLTMRPDKPFDRCAAMLEKRSFLMYKPDFEHAAKTVERALKKAERDDAVLACGSLYMIGAAKQMMLKHL